MSMAKAFRDLVSILRGGESSSREAGHERDTVFVNRPSGPQDLDDPFLDEDAKQRFGEHIAKASEAARKASGQS